MKFNMEEKKSMRLCYKNTELIFSKVNGASARSRVEIIRGSINIKEVEKGLVM